MKKLPDNQIVFYIRSQNTPHRGDECESEYTLSRAEVSARSCKLEANTEGFQSSEVYQSNDGSVNLEVLYAEENIWLSQKKMADIKRY